MRPRSLASGLSILSAALVTICATTALAEQPPSPAPAPANNRSSWVMPGSESVVPKTWLAPPAAPPTAPSTAAPTPAPAPAPAAATPPPVRRETPAQKPASAPAGQAAPAAKDPGWMSLSQDYGKAPSRATRLPTAERSPEKTPSRSNYQGVSVSPSSTPIYGFTFTTDPVTPPKDRVEPTEPKKPSRTSFDLAFGTEAPISVGGIATLEVPGGVLFQAGAGVMPSAYTEAIDTLLTKIGAYDSAISSIVRGSISNSFVLRGSLGWRPFTNHGFEIYGGYSMMTANGSVAVSDVLNAILVDGGVSLQAPAGLSGDIPISATLHNVHGTLGWRWLLANDHLVIRASISYFQTVATHFQVKVPASATVLVPYEGMINDTVNSVLGSYLVKYAKAPTLGLSAGVRF